MTILSHCHEMSRQTIVFQINALSKLWIFQNKCHYDHWKENMVHRENYTDCISACLYSHYNIFGLKNMKHFAFSGFHEEYNHADTLLGDEMS